MTLPKTEYSQQSEPSGLTQSGIDEAVRRAVRGLGSDIPVIVPEGNYDEDALGISPKFIPNLPAQVYEALTGEQAPSEVVRIIFVPADYFYSWDNVSDADIEAVIRHEYGHHLSWEQITEETRAQDRFRGLLFDLVLHALYDLDEMNQVQRDAEYMYFRHRLRSEAAASDAAGLTRSDIERVICRQTGVEPCMCCAGRYVDIERLIEKPLAADTSEMPLSEVYDFVMDFMQDVIGNRMQEDLIFWARFEQTLTKWLELLV